MPGGDLDPGPVGDSPVAYSVTVLVGVIRHPDQPSGVLLPVGGSWEWIGARTDSISGGEGSGGLDDEGHLLGNQDGTETLAAQVDGERETGQENSGRPHLLRVRCPRQR
jgi:hypothetical protein